MSEKGKEDLALSIWNEMWSLIQERLVNFDYEMASVFHIFQKQGVSFKELYSIDFYEVLKKRVVAEINCIRREAMLHWLETFDEVLEVSEDDRTEYSNGIVKYLEEQLKDPEFLPFLYSSIDNYSFNKSYHTDIVNKIKNLVPTTKG